ncbi:MAG TPA: class IV adenylate cyclase [bacterium]|nr:class IV adenylate cyclase [bacterium]
MGPANIEVEMKARVRDPAAVAELLSRMGRPLGEIEYQDTYYCPAGTTGYTHERFRLRRSGNKATVTVKEKVEGKGAEASQEHEFEVSDAAAFIRFARAFGFKEFLVKSKKGRRWRVEAGPGTGAATVELWKVGGLGEFVEIEIMVDDKDRIAAARQGIREILGRLGVDEAEVEPRPYTLLLYELDHGQGSAG